MRLVQIDRMRFILANEMVPALVQKFRSLTHTW